MKLTQNLIDKGFELCKMTADDFNEFLKISKICFEIYIDEFFGAWVDDLQYDMNFDMFKNTLSQTFCDKIIMNGETVGFISYDETAYKIEEVSLKMIPKAQNLGLGSLFLNKITSLSYKTNKPAFLKVFKSNPAQNLYKRFGFEIYDETHSHYLMRYDPKTL